MTDALETPVQRLGWIDDDDDDDGRDEDDDDDTWYLGYFC